MHLIKHDDALCPSCGKPIAYGAKEEPSCWKLVVQCSPVNGCGRDLGRKRVPLSEVEHRDEIAAEAQELAAEVGR